MTIVLEARELSQTYRAKRGFFAPAASVKALAGVSFALETGRTLAIVGESGSGKSTLGRLITMIERPASGRLFVNGIDPVAAGAAERRRLRRDVQIVFQNPYASLNPRQTVGDALEEPLIINDRMPAPARREAVREMLSKVGLRPEHADRYPHMFSGGQRQRIAIARALMPRPRIVVLDEPVSALDVSIRAQILNLLAELQQDFGLAYVFISHDLSVVRHIADEVMVIYLGQAAEIASRDRLFDSPRHPYSRALLSATPVADPMAKKERIILAGETPSPVDPPAGCPFHPRCPLAFDRCRAERPPLRAADGRLVACFAVES